MTFLKKRETRPKTIRKPAIIPGSFRNLKQAIKRVDNSLEYQDTELLRLLTQLVDKIDNLHLLVDGTNRQRIIDFPSKQP